MQAKQVTLWVYADNEQSVQALQNELNAFVMNKYKQGIIVKADTLRALLQRYGNSAIVNACLKQ